jgi:hypothetical protein
MRQMLSGATPPESPHAWPYIGDAMESTDAPAHAASETLDASTDSESTVIDTHQCAVCSDCP